MSTTTTLRIFPTYDSPPSKAFLCKELLHSSTFNSVENDGIVTAETTTNTVEGFPTEAQLASSIRCFLEARLLAPSVLRPCQQVGEVTKISICPPKSSRALLFRRHHSMHITDTAGRPYAGGVHFVVFQRGYETNLLLKDKRKKPLALCVSDQKRRTHHIHGTRPLLVRDSPLLRRGNVQYYPWYRITNDSIQLWNGQSYEPIREKINHDHDSCILIASDHDTMGYAWTKEGETNVTIAPGVDPCLILCIAALQI